MRNILGYDLTGKTLNGALADEIFAAIRIDFAGNNSSWPVIGSGGVKASDAMNAGVLKISGADGGKGFTAELTAYLANVTSTGGNGVASSAQNGPQIVNGLLVVPDGSGNDGKISGTMLMSNKPGTSTAPTTDNTTGGQTDTGTNTNPDSGTAQSSGGGGGGCNALSLVPILAALVFIRKR